MQAVRHTAGKGAFGNHDLSHCSVQPDPVLRGRVERQCLEYYARRADACIVEQLPGVDALLARDAEGTRYELYLVELTAGNAPAGLKAADTLRRHGARAPLAFFAHTPAHAYNAYRVDAMQYLLLPFRPEQFTALLDRATEPEYGPVIAVSTAAGLRALPFANIEYLECTHHVVHFHLATGEDVPSPLPPGALCGGGKAPAGGRPLFAAPPLLCGQPGGGRAAGGRRVPDAERGPVPIPAARKPPSEPSLKPGWNKIRNANKETGEGSKKLPSFLLQKQREFSRKVCYNLKKLEPTRGRCGPWPGIDL